MKKIFILVASLFILSSCGKSEGDTEKNLFSRWDAKDGEFLDFSNGSFNKEIPSTLIMPTMICYGTQILAGNQNAGTFVFSSSTYKCPVPYVTATYKKTKDKLTMCSAKGCSDFY